MMRSINLGIKRFSDVLVSAVCIIILFVVPVFEVVFIVIKLSSRGPAVFTQTRIGKDKKPFKMYKFRTMIVEQFDKNGNEIMSEDRITPIGRVLRKTSLDEIPQLFNILNGSMSIVGPRPMLDYQAERCNKEENGRFAMRPGVTGWAQVKGRNNIQWPERIQYDLEYIRNFNVWEDIKIIIMTFTTVFTHEGTDVKAEYRGGDRFSKHYHPETEGNKTRNEYELTSADR